LKPLIPPAGPAFHLNYSHRFLEFERLNYSGKIGIVSAIRLNIAVERVGIVNTNGKFNGLKSLLGLKVVLKRKEFLQWVQMIICKKLLPAKARQTGNI
jgi:hypothetical protein